MASDLLFVFGLLALAHTLNALRRPARPGSRLPPVWLPAMLVREMAPLLLAGRTLVGMVLLAMGGGGTSLGMAGVVMLGAAQIGAAWLWRDERRAVAELSAGIPEQLIPPPAPRWRRRPPFPTHVGRLTIDQEHGIDLLLPSSGPSPCLFYVHGGSWTGGDPYGQAVFAFQHLVSLGWVVALPRYPLSPRAVFPEHLESLRASLNTVGRRPEVGRIVVAGASAGAHLAALLALDEQTRAAGAVVFYGVYDFFNRHRTRPDWPLIPRKVMQTTPEQRPDLYRLASPLDQIRPGAPPFMVVHGDHDSLVPPAESRIFVSALREAAIPVRYLEVRGAQHAFDVFPTPRARAAWGAVIGFCLDVAEGELTAGGC